MRLELESAGLACLVIATATIAQAQDRGIAGRVSALEAKAATLERQVSAAQARLDTLDRRQRPYSASVDCDAGGSVSAALDAAPDAAPEVDIAVSGTCRELVHVRRDHVTITGQTGATIEAPAGNPWTIFVSGGQDVRLDHLTVRGAPLAIHIRHGHVEGSDFLFQGGVSATMGSIVRLYSPTVIEGRGVVIDEGSSVAMFGCDIRDAAGSGVSVESSTFHASGCRIQRAGEYGVVAEIGANVRLEEVEVTDSGKAGIAAGLGSAVLIQTPSWRQDGSTVRSRIAGSPIGLWAWSGSSVRLGHVTIEGNGDGVWLEDSSVVERDKFGDLKITGNTQKGIDCDLPPAAPQLLLVDSSSVFGNAGGDIVCAGY